MKKLIFSSLALLALVAPALVGAQSADLPVGNLPLVEAANDPLLGPTLDLEATELTPIPETPMTPVLPIAPVGNSSGGATITSGGGSSGQSTLVFDRSRLVALLTQMQNQNRPVVTVKTAGQNVVSASGAEAAPVATQVTAETEAAPASGLAADQLVASAGQTEIGFFTRVGNWFVRLFQRFI